MSEPYRQFVSGQSVRPMGQLSKYIDGYYPNNRFVIEEVNEFEYKVRPLGSTDLLEANHFDLIPVNLMRSHFFVPCEMVKVGVAVRKLDTKQYNLVKESKEDSVVLNDGNVLKNEVVEIMKFMDDPNDINYYLREQ